MNGPVTFIAKVCLPCFQLLGYKLLAVEQELGPAVTPFIWPRTPASLER